LVAVSRPPPLAEHDDRSSFDCGRDSINMWFHRHAWFNHSGGASRVTVLTGAASGRIVDKNYQGQGHATSLLLYALKTALNAADMIGSVGVITHPLDDNVRRLYSRWGFQELPFDPRRAMIVRMVDLRASFAGL
jgi:GNAT superfamily N-acetyltransferase